MNGFVLKATEYISTGLKTIVKKNTWFPTMESISMRDLQKPKGVVFEITNACNSRCKSCNIWQTVTEKNMLTANEIIEIFKNELFDELESFIITGGEPILRNDLYEIITGLNKVRPNAVISLSTNGILGDKLYKLISDLFFKGGLIRLSVGVSVDAVGEEHDDIRGVPGNFESVDKLLEALSVLKGDVTGELEVIVGQTFSPLTAAHIAEVSSYADKKNAHYLPQLYEEFSYYGNIDNAVGSGQKGKIKGAIGHHKSGCVKDSQAYTLDPLLIIKSFPPSFQREVMLKAITQNRPIMHPGKIVKKNFCASLNTFFLLRANGDVAPCLQHSNYKAGNLKCQAADTIWVSGLMKNGRKLVSQCNGCSNTWATSWSAKYCFFPFIPLIVKTMVKKMISGSK